MYSTIAVKTTQAETNYYLQLSKTYLIKLKKNIFVKASPSQRANLVLVIVQMNLLKTYF
jgi:hypothetical protein